MENRSSQINAGALVRRERRLAYKLLLPTFLLVSGVVLFPLFANFWISFKPVLLADLRSPELSIREKVFSASETKSDKVRLEYRYRNPSKKYNLTEVKFDDRLPDGASVQEVDPRCKVKVNLVPRVISCELGALEPKARGRVAVTLAFFEPVSARQLLLKTKPEASFQTKNVLTSFEFTLSNYFKLFSSAEFWNVLKITIYYTVFGTAGALLMGLFAAQIMRSVFPGRAIVRGFLLFPYVAPVIAVAFSWVVLFDPFSGVINHLFIEMGEIKQPINFFGQRTVEVELFGHKFGLPLALSMVILFEIWRYFPLSFLFILARMQSIPKDIYEAAEMDGASPLQQFWFLSLPNIVGILAILFLLRFIWTFNKFDDIFLLTGGNAGTRTLTVNVYEQAFAISNLGAGAAVASVVFVILLSVSGIFIYFLPKDHG